MSDMPNSSHSSKGKTGAVPGSLAPASTRRPVPSAPSLATRAELVTSSSTGSLPSPPPASGSSSTAAPSSSPELKGWLYKWTNYIKGYQRRYFCLSNGLLSYYRSPAESAHTCRGTISLHSAIIQTEDACNFVVSNGGGTKTFHLRASSEVERQKWVTALELAKTKAIQTIESSDEEVASDNGDGEASAEFTKEELMQVIKVLSAKLEDLTTCATLIGKHGSALQTSLSELNLEKALEQAPADQKQALKERIKASNERAALMKITSNAMVKASSDFVQQCQTNGRKWQRLLSQEREIRQRLEYMVEQYARQHSHLEAMVRKEHHIMDPAAAEDNFHNHELTPLPRSAPVDLAQAAVPASSSSADVGKSVTSTDTEDEEDRFEDAVDKFEFEVTAPPRYAQERKSSSSRTTSKEDMDDDEDGYTDEETEPDSGKAKTKIQVFRSQRTLAEEEEKRKLSADGTEHRASVQLSSAAGGQLTRKMSQRKRRSRIPDKPNISISLWGIVKNCIGKDLTKIPVPVNFSEPLSMLQRLTEDYEYSEILDRAAECSDQFEQMAYVAAFTVSSYSTTAIRSSKPFNPLLGETFECDRADDKGFRVISEQVSHHPPMLAQYGESSTGLWRCWQEFSMRSKFKGKYLEIEPVGLAHLVFPKTNNHYTWRKVKTVVHNIVIGKLWVDQTGEMSVINHKTNDKCHMKFEPYSYFGGTPKKVTGTIVNASDKVEWVLNGTWDAKLEGSKVISEALVKGKSGLEIGPPVLLWEVNPIPEGAENYYFFSQFACELNEPEDGVAPTDSRLRPDQRLMENAEWDEANKEKVRLEEKQRAVRKRREEEAADAAAEGRPHDGHSPTWFKREPDEQNGGKYIFAYKGGYWESKAKQDWHACPDIY